jgi:uncharacterized protein (TIGR03790 family)
MVSMRTARSRHLLAYPLAGLLGISSTTWAQDGTNVLLVVNTGSAVSARVAARYVHTRAIPPENVVRLKTDTDDEITREQYEREIEQPISQWITRQSAEDRILYIVLTKGMPLRIRGTTGRNGTVASVDSELTLLYRRLVGVRVPTLGPSSNPYFRDSQSSAEAKPFTHADYDVYLVSRLDGFNEADVVGLIGRGSSPTRGGDFLLDLKGPPAGGVADHWLRATADALEVAGYKDRVVLESTTGILRDRRNVLGYSSWGSNDSSIRTRRFGFGFVPGALAAMFVSTDARTLQEPPDGWQPGNARDPQSFFAGSSQSLTGDLIREGVSGVAGHVAEPFLDGTIRPDILFPAYVAGFNLIESFYLAMPYLSWQTVVFGDPLCAPFRNKVPPREETVPDLDVDTELPKYFSRRRLAFLTSAGIASNAAKLMLKGEARRGRADTAGARQALEEATAIEPRVTAAQLLLAGVYEELGEHDLAIERYRRVLAVAPNEPVSLNNLAYALAVYKKAPAEALPIAQQAYAASKGDAAAITDTLGWIHYLLGNHSEAEKLLAEAASTAPDNAEIHLHLAHAYVALGRRELAVAAIARSIQLDPKLADRDDVKKLQGQLGRR